MNTSFDKKCAPSAYMENTQINLTPEQLMNKRFPITNPDRYAILSYLMDEKENKSVFVRIYGMYPTVKQAEEVIREAIAKGYTYFDMIIADTRSWLPFPPQRFERESQGNERLRGLLKEHITETKNEVLDLKKRVKDAKPTTPFETYKDFIKKQAKVLIEKMDKGDKDYIAKLEKDFRVYQEMAQKKSDEAFQKAASEVDFESLTK